MPALENRERRILALLRESGGIALGVQDLLSQTGWSDQAHVVGAAMGLVEKEYASMEEDVSSRVRLGPEGIMALQVGLLEKRLMDWLTSVEPDQRTMAALSAAFDKSESGPGVGLLRGPRSSNRIRRTRPLRSKSRRARGAAQDGVHTKPRRQPALGN